MDPQQYYQHYQSVRHGVPPAPPVSPVSSSEEQADHVFVPADIMTVNNRIVPEKVMGTIGEPVDQEGPDRPRTALAEAVPRPILPVVAPPVVQGATEFAPVSRLLIRRSSAHVFMNLTEPAPLSTDWETKPVLDATGSHTVEAPILPAPLDTMLRAGEGYVIKDADTGKVLKAHPDLAPTSPEAAHNIVFDKFKGK